jgi:polyisoprenoid-binding protein YceI
MNLPVGFLNSEEGTTMKNLLTPAIRKMLVILGIASLTALPVFAQEGKWKIDAEHSTASIFLGNNLDLQTVGIARIGGIAKFNSAEPAKSALDISGELAEGQAMTFKSKRIDLRADGKLQITGDMTLARTERDAAYNLGEDYRGPVYGESVVRTVTRNVTFVLPLVDNAEGKAEITAEAILGGENFPELFAAVRQAAWQPVLEDEACEMSQAAEDYRGVACTGKLIAPAYQVAAIRIGEDYRGDESPAPSGNLMKIVLRLQLNRQTLG